MTSLLGAPPLRPPAPCEGPVAAPPLPARGRGAARPGPARPGTAPPGPPRPAPPRPAPPGARGSGGGDALRGGARQRRGAGEGAPQDELVLAAGRAPPGAPGAAGRHQDGAARGAAGHRLRAAAGRARRPLPQQGQGPAAAAACRAAPGAAAPAAPRALVTPTGGAPRPRRAHRLHRLPGAGLGRLGHPGRAVARLHPGVVAGQRRAADPARHPHHPLGQPAQQDGQPADHPRGGAVPARRLHHHAGRRRHRHHCAAHRGRRQEHRLRENRPGRHVPHGHAERQRGQRLGERPRALPGPAARACHPAPAPRRVPRPEEAADPPVRLRGLQQGVHQELPPQSPPADTHGREALQVHLGGLHLEVRPLRRADPALPQAHRHQALPLLGLRPQLLPLRPPGPAPPAAHHDVRSAATGGAAASHPGDCRERAPAPAWDGLRSILVLLWASPPRRQHLEAPPGLLSALSSLLPIPLRSPSPRAAAWGRGED